MYSVVIIADNTESCSWTVVFLLYIQKMLAKDIPGGSVVETLCFQCRGCRFSCWLKN